MMRPKKQAREVDLGRREISALAALVLLGGATITITGCGGGSPSPTGPSAAPLPTPTPTPATNSGDKVGEIASDPSHTAVITAAQLAAGGALTLDIQGRQTHSHIVELSAQEVLSIRDGQRVQKQSSLSRGHNHLVIFNY